MTSSITTLFLDIGGVLLTNGWGHEQRRRAAEAFELDPDELEARHHATYEPHEIGKLALDVYLDRVIFHRRRTFSREAFLDFMRAQSRPLPGAIEFFSDVAARNGLRVVAVSNEGRDLAEHRLRTFRLRTWMHSFVCSAFVGVRKPDEEIFRIAIDTSQAEPRRTVYLDDRAMFAEVAGSLGLHGIHHVDVATTRSALAALGLRVG